MAHCGSPVRADLGKEKQTMKKLGPMSGGWKPSQETTVTLMNRTLKTVWMADLKKAGERAEILWFKNRKRGAC
jgi:hypothetical protein